jgi:hypothetical protein
MAIVYYPKNSIIYRRDTQNTNGLYEELVLNCSPDVVLYFDTSSATSVLSASVLIVGVSSSYAYTSSYVPTGRSIVLCSAYTPTIIGPDAAEVTIPFSPIDGTSSMSWNIKRLLFRAQSIESFTSSLNIEKSSATGSFSSSFLNFVTLNSGSYENSVTGSGSITSGDKLRFNVTQLGTAQNWTVITELSNT